MKYSKAMEYLEECSKYGIVPGLDNMRHLLDQLGNPQNHLKYVHIAGTNGKGSVLNYISTILKENGYKTGSYHSPAVFDCCEKFQIGGRSIAKAAYGRLMDEVFEAAETTYKVTGNHPTSFEIETALAFLYFERKNCDIVVVETGMGGKMDATNVIPSPFVCVLTPVGLDHTGFLGESLEEIAYHKAGIMKEGSIAISACQEVPVEEVFRNVSIEQKVKKLMFINTNHISKIKYGIAKQSFEYKGIKYEIGIAGTWQIENAVLALEAVQALREQGLSFHDEKIHLGLKKAQWPGRFQNIAKKPYIIIDGAHNYQAVKELKKSVEFYFTNKKIIYIIGMFRDKDYKKSVAGICGMANHVITVSTRGNTRALSSYELAAEVIKVNPVVTAVDSVQEAVELSSLLADQNTVIIAFGSLSYLGQLVSSVNNSFK